VEAEEVAASPYLVEVVVEEVASSPTFLIYIKNKLDYNII
jgi:hypothetical protein